MLGVEPDRVVWRLAFGKQLTAIAGAGLAACAVILGSAVALRGESASEETGSPDQGQPGQHAFVLDADLGNGVVAAASPDLPCVVDATPDLGPRTDKRIFDALESNWASQADPPREPMTRSDAIDAARRMSTLAREASTAGTPLDTASIRSAAVRASYQAADAWIGGAAAETSLVAPQRCVWVVTVDAPFVPRSSPPGVRVNPYRSYTAMFDARSGQYLAVSAGVDAADLITGERLTGR